MNIEEILEKWYNTKQELTRLEKKCEHYKRQIRKVMEHKHTDSISSSDFKVTRRHIERETIAKKDLPRDIWKQYASLNEYESFYINMKKK